jgi:hypothetical protein
LSRTGVAPGERSRESTRSRLSGSSRRYAVADDRIDKLSEDFREWLEMEVLYVTTDIEIDIFLDVET